MRLRNRVCCAVQRWFARSRRQVPRDLVLKRGREIKYHLEVPVLWETAGPFPDETTR